MTPGSQDHARRFSGGDERPSGRPSSLLEDNEEDERTVVDFMLFDMRNPSSILSCVSLARENARCIRDQLASEVW